MTLAIWGTVYWREEKKNLLSLFLKENLQFFSLFTSLLVNRQGNFTGGFQSTVSGSPVWRLEKAAAVHTPLCTHTSSNSWGSPRAQLPEPSVQREAGQGFQAGDLQSMLRRNKYSGSRIPGSSLLKKSWGGGRGGGEKSV